MPPDPDETRNQMLDLLDKTYHDTRALLFSLDPDRIIHTDERAWRVRDILGHLSVWNMEAARSLQAYADGSEYRCILSEEEYYDYNGPAAEVRKSWTMEQVWAEYESAHAKLRQLVASMPDKKWTGDMLYPWNLRGTVEYLIIVMMKHETIDHCMLVVNATT
jgi:DinB superfamily